MWIDDASDEILRTWVKHCPAMKLVSTLDGQILWANAAFCDWSQYTLSELKKLTWMQISVPDKNLEADIEETKHLDAYNPSYTVRKQYVPKSSAPEWGQLTVMRYPLTGDIQCCLCTWEPLKNGTAKAFAMAMEHNREIAGKLAAMTTEIQTLTKQSDEDKLILGTIRFVQRHPKLAWGFLVIAASVFGLNNIVELLQRTGLIHLPVKVEPVGQSTVQHATEISQPEAKFVALRSVQLSDGRSIEWETNEDGRRTSLPTFRRRSGAGDIGLREGRGGCETENDGCSGSGDCMPRGTSGITTSTDGNSQTF